MSPPGAGALKGLELSFSNLSLLAHLKPPQCAFSNGPSQIELRNQSVYVSLCATKCFSHVAKVEQNGATCSAKHGPKRHKHVHPLQLQESRSNSYRFIPTIVKSSELPTLPTWSKAQFVFLISCAPRRSTGRREQRNSGCLCHCCTSVKSSNIRSSL